MKNTTKKNLERCGATLNKDWAIILQTLTKKQKASEDEIISIVQGIRESLDEHFDKILDTKPVKTCKKKVNKAPAFEYRKILGFCK